MADYKTLSGLDLDISGYTESVTRSKKTLEEVSRKNRGIGAKPETETVELDNNFLEGIAQLFRDNGYEPKQPSEDTTTTPKDEVLEEYSKLMKSEIIQDAMKELSTLGESPNKLEDIYTSMDTDFVTLENQPTVDSEGDTLDIRQTEPLGLMSKVSPVVTSDKPIMAETPTQPDLKADVDSEILSPRFLNAIGITGNLTEKGVQAEVKKVLKEQGMSDEEITNLVNKSLGAVDDTIGKESIEQKTKAFYLNIGKKAEGDHGDIPKPTNDSREAKKPIDERSKDIGYGHKVKENEEASGFIHGIKFKNEDGSYIPLTEEQKIKILNADMALELKLAREQGWDAKLKAIGTKWENLDSKYQNALNSLAYNVGGPKAAKQWTAVLFAAKDENVLDFALEMRRMDDKKYTAGMDNRVVKELYYAGIISNFSEVSSVLPLATADGAGVPK